MIYQIGRCFLSALVLPALAAVVLGALVLAADDPGKGKGEEARQQQGLQNMQRSAAHYRLFFADTPERALDFRETPIMRISNPISGTADGALYVWSNHGRPQAVLKFFTFNQKAYSHALLSLSESNLVAERNGKVVWSPSEPGVQLRELPGSPVPAIAAAERLRQMRTLAGKFSATYTAKHLHAKPFELRLLTQPLLRYETDDEYHADGALFGYVQSTTPIGLLLLESRQTPDGPRWHYAYTSLVTGPVTARYEDKEVFSLERDAASTDPARPFILFRSLPVPKE